MFAASITARRFRLLARVVASASILLAGGALSLPASAQQVESVRSIRFWALGEVTRIAVESSGPIEYFADRAVDPDRLFFDLHRTRMAIEGADVRQGVTIPVGDQRIRQIRVGLNRKNVTRVVLDLNRPVEYTCSELDNPHRLIIEIRDAGPEPRTLPRFAPEFPAPQAAPPEDLEITLEPPKIATNTATLGAPPAAVAPPLSARSVRPPPPPRQAPVTASPRPANPVGAEPGRTVEPGTDAPRQTATPPASAPSSARKEPAATPDKPVASSRAPAVEESRAAAVPVAPPAPSAPATRQDPPVAEAKPARPASNGARSLVRAMGLKVGRVVIDAGHGGHDTGTISPSGLYEKDIVLDIALRLGKLIEGELGHEVIYTRKDDTFVSLTDRTRIANESRADLFVSVHLNSSPMQTISGAETFFLSLTNSRYSLDVAARENASVSNTVYDLQEFIQRIALTDKVEESREFALTVQKQVHSRLGPTVKAPKDRGIKRAPFVVLIGAQMPAVLVEVGFLSNAREESLLKKPEHRQSVAQALFSGISEYAATLSRLDVAKTGTAPPAE